jgi:hypothetical protein
MYPDNDNWGRGKINLISSAWIFLYTISTLQVRYHDAPASISTPHLVDLPNRSVHAFSTLLLRKTVELVMSNFIWILHY